VCPHTTYVRELASEITYGLVGADRGGEIAECREEPGDGGRGAPGALAVGAYGLGRRVLGRGLWAEEGGEGAVDGGVRAPRLGGALARRDLRSPGRRGRANRPRRR
jgi:hypothetical protein